MAITMQGYCREWQGNNRGKGHCEINIPGTMLERKNGCADGFYGMIDLLRRALLTGRVDGPRRVGI